MNDLEYVKIVIYAISSVLICCCILVGCWFLLNNCDSPEYYPRNTTQIRLFPTAENQVSFIRIPNHDNHTDDKIPKVTRGRRASRQSYQYLSDITNERRFAPTQETTTNGIRVNTIDEDGFVILGQEPTGSVGPNVTVTTQHVSASPVVQPPYPVEPRHPTPHGPPQGIGFATHHNPPYPTHTPHPTPAPFYYPPPVGGAPCTQPQPTYLPAGDSAPYPDYSAQPPSYSEAVRQPPVPIPPSKEVYSKQAPYNPNY